MHTSVSTATSATRAPTAQQWAVMGFLFDFLSTEDRLPTRAEIALAFGWRSPTGADDHLKALVRRGFIEKRGTHYRFARTPKGRDAIAALCEQAAEAEAA